jgi:chorismate-pyruvate lyase
MVDVANPSGLEIALADAGGTVTALVERLVGEPIDAQVQSQYAMPADRSNGLGVEVGHPLLVRTAVLTGRRSGRPFVYAESVLVPSRLPERFCVRIGTAGLPIGRILEEEGIAVTRSPVGGSGRGTETVRSAAPLATDHLLYRTYRVDVEGSPAMVIAEWFLASLEQFVAHGDGDG